MPKLKRITIAYNISKCIRTFRSTVTKVVPSLLSDDFYTRTDTRTDTRKDSPGFVEMRLRSWKRFVPPEYAVNNFAQKRQKATVERRKILYTRRGAAVEKICASTRRTIRYRRECSSKDTSRRRFKFRRSSTAWIIARERERNDERRLRGAARLHFYRRRNVRRKRPEEAVREMAKLQTSTFLFGVLSRGAALSVIKL